MAVLHNPRLSRILTLCVLGVLACGVSLAFAGATPRPPADPIDALPAGVIRIREWTCATDLATAMVPPVTVTQAPGPTQQEDCWHIALVRSRTETGNQLADRLAQHFTGRGFEFSGVTSGEFRALTATLAQCGTTATIDTGFDAVSLPPGTRASMPPGFLSGPNGPAGFGPSMPGMPGVTVVPGQPPASDATGASVPDATDTTGVLPPSSVITDPGLAPPQAIDESLLEQLLQGTYANPNALPSLMHPSAMGSVIVVASTQARAVVPRALEGRC